LPYPFLSAFIERRTGNRFQKRVVFDHSDFDDLLGKIIEQIDDKKTKDKNAKGEKLEKEIEEMSKWRSRLWQE